MSITHDYIVEELSRDRIAQLQAEAEAARVAVQATRRPRGSRPVARPWWRRLFRTGSTARPRTA